VILLKESARRKVEIATLIGQAIRLSRIFKGADNANQDIDRG
jgi:hypothetical protein